MDLDSDDDDFEPKAKPGSKSKRTAGDSDEDFAPMKQRKRKKKDEVPCKTSTQKVDSAAATGISLIAVEAGITPNQLVAFIGVSLTQKAATTCVS